MGCTVYKMEGNIQHVDGFLCLFGLFFSNNNSSMTIIMMYCDIIWLPCIAIYCNTLLLYHDAPNSKVYADIDYL
jgi:hypothetical protein